MAEAQRQMLQQLQLDEASHANQLRVTEAQQEATYENVQRRLDVMRNTHHLYQEKTEQELAQLRPYADEWSNYSLFRQLQKEGLVYEAALKERAVETCNTLRHELAEAEGKI